MELRDGAASESTAQIIVQFVWSCELVLHTDTAKQVSKTFDKHIKDVQKVHKRKDSMLAMLPLNSSLQQYGCQQSLHSESVSHSLALLLEVTRVIRYHVKVVSKWKVILKVVNRLHSQALQLADGLLALQYTCVTSQIICDIKTAIKNIYIENLKLTAQAMYMQK